MPAPLMSLQSGAATLLLQRNLPQPATGRVLQAS